MSIAWAISQGSASERPLMLSTKSLWVGSVSSIFFQHAITFSVGLFMGIELRFNHFNKSSSLLSGLSATTTSFLTSSGMKIRCCLPNSLRMFQ
jgi:hypothetical protein